MFCFLTRDLFVPFLVKLVDDELYIASGKVTSLYGYYYYYLSYALTIKLCVTRNSSTLTTCTV